MLTIWLIVAVAALLLLGVLGYGLFGQVRRLSAALRTAQSDTAPRVQEISEGIRRAAQPRTPDKS